MRDSDWERNEGLEVFFADLTRVKKNDLSTAVPEDGLEIKSWFGCDGNRKYKIFL